MTHPTRGYARRVLWQESLPSTPPSEPRPLPDRADVVVVGGGYTGLSAALRLARSGARVVLVERHGLGWGASTRNGGIVHAGLQLGLGALRRRYGPELGERLHRAGVDCFFRFERFLEDERLDAHYARTGLVVLAWSRAHLVGAHEELREARERRLHGRVLAGDELHTEIATDVYPGGLLIEEAGAIDPARYHAALASIAEAAGADLQPLTAALSIERTGGTLRVTTSRGTVVAQEVLLATNGYTDRLLPWLRRRIIPIGSYIIATERVPDALRAELSPRGRVYFDSKNFLNYWRFSRDGRLVFGGRASFAPTSVDRSAAILRRQLHRIHPQTRSLRIDYAWGGKVGFTFDRLPHIGRHEGVSYALGYCGSGVAMATTLGLHVGKRLATGWETAAEPSPFGEIPHPGVPLLPGLYRERPWFLPLAGELFRAADRWTRRGLPIP